MIFGHRQSNQVKTSDFFIRLFFSLMWPTVTEPFGRRKPSKNPNTLCRPNTCIVLLSIDLRLHNGSGSRLSTSWTEIYPAGSTIRLNGNVSYCVGIFPSLFTSENVTYRIQPSNAVSTSSFSRFNSLRLLISTVYGGVSTDCLSASLWDLAFTAWCIINTTLYNQHISYPVA